MLSAQLHDKVLAHEALSRGATVIDQVMNVMMTDEHQN